MLCYLWRAVDHEGEVLESVVTAKRDKAAALRFLKRIMKKYGRPLSVVTDGLCSYPAAMKEIGNSDRQEVGRRLNNRAPDGAKEKRRARRAAPGMRTAALENRRTRAGEVRLPGLRGDHRAAGAVRLCQAPCRGRRAEPNAPIPLRYLGPPLASIADPADVLLHTDEVGCRR